MSDSRFEGYRVATAIGSLSARPRFQRSTGLRGGGFAKAGLIRVARLEGAEGFTFEPYDAVRHDHAVEPNTPQSLAPNLALS